MCVQTATTHTQPVLCMHTRLLLQYIHASTQPICPVHTDLNSLASVNMYTPKPFPLQSLRHTLFTFCVSSVGDSMLPSAVPSNTKRPRPLYDFMSKTQQCSMSSLSPVFNMFLSLLTIILDLPQPHIHHPLRRLGLKFDGW